ncbi:MAG TPA: S8 family serine peptidase [Chitinophagaceae bacterium]|nr:S8 family serine peptidase [Chitinophagaceae bacterium]
MAHREHIVCPLCGDQVDKLVYRYHVDNEKFVLQKIKERNPGWTVNDGACSRCVDYYHTEVVMQQRMLPEVGPYFPIKSADDFIILPTPLRLDADARFTGKGVTICFIDSGFYPHPDLTAHGNRIKLIVDINKQSASSKVLPFGENSCAPAWHGTMTSVVCAGDGFLSNGLYKGIASNAELVLVKAMNNEGHITTENIVKALQWVLKNFEKYDIRIVNMSLGDDAPASYKHSEVDRLAEELVRNGIVVVAAVGNDEYGIIKPPANSPHVITVGGFDDDNDLNDEAKLYHSSYGLTDDGLMKPELLANAIWIAAPILPGTKEQREADILYRLAKTDDDRLVKAVSKLITYTKLDEDLSQSKDVTFIREAIVRRIQTCKYISPHYMHVDGTSFAAPIVCSLIAQMLEANPRLTPFAVRDVLFSTAKRIDNMPAERQGFGVLRPRKAILKVLKREVIMKANASPFINPAKKSIEFYMQSDCASQISVAGSFNHWAQDVLLLEPGRNGLWKIEIPMLPAGKYAYKFFIDDKMWMEDVDNPYREPDGFAGFNSLLIVEDSILSNVKNET